jgi:hypothetical protein
MFQLRSILTAHFSSWAGRMDILDEVWVPKWLDRRWAISTRRDRRRLERSERTSETEPLGKDASKDW